MSSEQNAPEVHEYQGQQAPPANQDQDGQFTGSNIPHGMGQSKSSRRRRRKRKGKGTEAAGAPGAQASQSSPGPASVFRPIHSFHAGRRRAAAKLLKLRPAAEQLRLRKTLEEKVSRS